MIDSRFGSNRGLRWGPLFLAASVLAFWTALSKAQEPSSDPDLDAIRDNLEIIRAHPEGAAQAGDWIEAKEDATRKELESADSRLLELDGSIKNLRSSEENLRTTLNALETAFILLTEQGLKVGEAIEALDPTAPGTLSARAGGGAIDFNRDIRPILADHCYACHGPDENTRKAKLRLDLKDEALRVLKPGDPEGSELFRRVSTQDENDVMPPTAHGGPLSDDKISLLRDWILEGASITKHWAFETPLRPDSPAVENAAWVQSPIDRFVLLRLEENGLAPSPEADKRTLIRRLSFDLLGLPPTAEEVRTFVADESADAYEKLVERYLASKHYGERMGLQWLDLARYADSDGYHMDYVRSMWQYRDWVMNAFNDNKPFDEFTVEQLAGDLLPNPSKDQLIATAFNRNGMTSTEGGADAAEYLTKYVIDRVITTGGVFLGLTIGCAECHDHKFDPISQGEFYQLYDYFHQIPEAGLDKDPCPPFLELPTAEQETELTRLDSELADAKTLFAAKISDDNAEWDAAQLEWEEERANLQSWDWRGLEVDSFESHAGATLKRLDDGSSLVEGPVGATDVYTISFKTDLDRIAGLRLETLPDDSLKGKGPGRSGNGNIVLTGIEATSLNTTEGNFVRALTLQQPVADHSQENFHVAGVLDGNPESGWAILPDLGEAHHASFTVKEPDLGEGEKVLTLTLRFESKFANHTLGRFRISASPDRAPRLRTWSALGPFPADSPPESFTKRYGPEDEFDLAKTYRDGELSWVQHPEWVDGVVHNLDYDKPAATYLHRTIHAVTTTSMLFTFGSNDGVQAWLNGESIHVNDVARGINGGRDKAVVTLEPGDNNLLVKINNHGGAFAFFFNASTDTSEATDGSIHNLLQVARDERSAEQIQEIRKHYRTSKIPEVRALDEKLASLQEDRNKLGSQVATIRIMRDMEERRESHVLIRGDYRRKGDLVKADVPAFVGIPVEEEEHSNRLDLARWLVDPKHPLTARVTVNRYWQTYFGNGLVKTSEDFGTRGERPSHPGLLDWLAVEFVESGWDVKAMQRLIVTSAAYRQSSKVTPELLERDPENRLIARGPRFRLQAELVRDNALAISGLLDRDRPIGGPSVKPYQPEGLWREKAIGDGYGQRYVRDDGDKLFRRGLYTFIKRSVPFPSYVAFDCPNREISMSRREVTNTPLQAFVALNENTYVEAARHFATRILEEGGTDIESRLTYAYERALARPPKEEEIDILASIQEKNHEVYQADLESASSLVHIGDTPVPEELDLSELASWTTVASAILNLDETVTKE